MARLPPQPMGRPRECAVCGHPERGRIEALRASGASLDALAQQFGVHRDCIWRHWRKHVSDARRARLIVGPAKVEELVNAAADESRSLLDYLTISRSILFSTFLTAAEAGDFAAVGNIGARLLENLRELGRLTGELRQVSGVSITNNTIFLGSPAFTQLTEGLLKVCRAHPDAKGAIIALLRELDARDGAAPLPAVIEQSSRFEAAADVG